MKLENPPQPEQYDPDAEQPVRELVILLVAVLAITLVATAALAWLAGGLAPRLPFTVEREFMAGKMAVDERYAAESAELQRLAERIAAAMALDADMKLTLHYSDDLAVNAYATLGGHVVVHRGLIARVGSENALAAVLAHEIAHALLLHPPTPPLDEFGCRNFDGDLEDEAKWLAGALLVTEAAAVTIAFRQLSDAEAALLYSVSEPMMRYRLNVTGARKRAARKLRSRAA